MKKQLAFTDSDKKHRITKKLFVTDQDKRQRKIKKLFRTVNGIFQLIYSSGVIWEKYNCVHESGDYYLDSDNSLIGTTNLMKTNIGDEVYGGYEFSPSEGFVGIDPVIVESEDNAIGRYIVEPYEVYLIIDMWNTETADMCGKYEDSYSQGSTSYGTIEVDDGELPESGTLIEGSYADGYCVLEIRGTYFYYVLQND